MTRRRNVVALCLLGLVGGLIWYGCGSGGGGDTPTATPTGADSANSLSDLPATSSLVAGSSASSSEGVKSLGKTPAGTPPVLKEIGSTVSVDTVFWGGLLAQINAASAGSITGDQQLAYWHGEGACRMAQAVGYSFQNILQGGTSLCYMQNAPGAENGVNIISGDVTASNIFDQVASDKVIKVSVSNMSMPGGEGGGGGSGGPEEIFIKVYGTGSTEGGAGYAVDLWFCNSSGTANGFEQIRVNNDADTITTTSVHSDFGNFVGSISAALTTNASGQLIFDSSKDRSATVYFGTLDGNSKFLGTVSINSAGLLTARDYQTGSFGGGSVMTNKHAVFASYSGDTMDDLRFSESSFALQDNFGGNPMSITDATEYQTSQYTDVNSGTLLDTAKAETFDADLYSGLNSSQYASAQTKLSTISSFSCSVTPDVTVGMDFSKSGPTAVAAKCENHFQNMEFCDGSTVQSARSKIFESQISGNQGTCGTSFCAPGDDFSCQLWADNNIGNTAGITTANAKCSNTGCCTKQ